ncbi:MAG: hypothetical protein WCK94_13665, partial [Comamonadaceae bacterium]
MDLFVTLPNCITMSVIMVQHSGMMIIGPRCHRQSAKAAFLRIKYMRDFFSQVHTLRWDDHRFYHQCR